MLTEIRRLFEHARWADSLLLAELRRVLVPPPEAVREYLHVLGADEAWLSRLERREARAAVWPSLSLDEGAALADLVHAGYGVFLDRLTASELPSIVAYTNTAGISFETPVGEILLHVALHGQYHRGKVNVLLRQAGLAPAPVDYIAFVRGAAAATTAAPPR